jgi:hypothetical protein
MELARRFERRSRTYEARALPTELHQHEFLEAAGRIALPNDLLCRQTPFCLGYAASTLERSTGIAPVLPEWRSGVLLLYELRLGERRVNAVVRELFARASQQRVAEPLYKWSEQREAGTRFVILDPRAGSPRHHPLYHARTPKTLAGVTGFEPAKTGFGDQRPSHRVLTPPPQRAKVARRGPRPVAVATGVEPVPPDRQSGILPLDSATTFNLAARARFERA